VDCQPERKSMMIVQQSKSKSVSQLNISCSSQPPANLNLFLELVPNPRCDPKQVLPFELVSSLQDGLHRWLALGLYILLHLMLVPHSLGISVSMLAQLHHSPMNLQEIYLLLHLKINQPTILVQFDHIHIPVLCRVHQVISYHHRCSTNSVIRIGWCIYP